MCPVTDTARNAKIFEDVLERARHPVKGECSQKYDITMFPKAAPIVADMLHWLHSFAGKALRTAAATLYTALSLCSAHLLLFSW